MIDGLSAVGLALAAMAVLGAAAAWTFYVSHRQPRRARATDDVSAALPPERAVPVDSALVQQLYRQREWRHIRPLLTDDFVLIGPDGAHAGLDAFRRENVRLQATYEDADSTVEAVLADLERPAVLYVRSRERARARRGPDLDVTAWTRIVVASSGTQVRELGPSSVIGRA